jgi:uncharacterized protein YggE
MRRLPLAAAGLALVLACPAIAAADSPRTITAIGTGEVDVKPTNRRSNSSIVKAIRDAQASLLPAAMAATRARAELLAAASGMQLGELLSVSDVPSVPYGPPINAVIRSPFGEGRWCGNRRRVVFRRDASGRRRRTGSRVVRSCFFPRELYAQLEMTFAATAKPAG